MDVRFHFSSESALRRTSDPLFVGFAVFGEELSATFVRKHHLRYRQLWQIGFSVLELSKLLMAKLWYDRIRPAFGGRVRLLFTDTVKERENS